MSAEEQKEEKESLIEKIVQSQIWKSMMRHGFPNTRRNRVLAVSSNVFLHLHPITIRKSGVRLSYTWGMGGITFYFFMIEVITGILLMFYYRPTAAAAYNDILALREHVTLGIFREMHRWGAHAMVLAVWLHMLRVFLTGAYKPPREFNWAIGVILLTLTLFLSFTGYLLPWDQLAIWAVSVGTNMAGAAPFIGAEGPGSSFLKIGDIHLIHSGSDMRFALLGGRFVGEATLLRFYVLHCVAVPFIAVLLMSVHFWRVRKDGGISSPVN
ncbi:MAG: cytochrome b N-terminal domain-containing protein [Deltaproteobacteria bacterium]|nr:cytochrome b N-terminal domain-containing protein [Deltaproteobacteria bacterium]